MAAGQKPFPDDFLWGASTAGHQVEGGNYDQWTKWELEHAVEMARTAEDRLKNMPDWEHFAKDAKDPDNYISGKGVAHYTKYREDFDIAQKLGLNAFRFSIEWSRLEPEEGVWDQKEIDHYHNYIAEMKKRGIEPVLNIWHWTHPVWFEERGGFSRKENLSFWLRHVQKLADEYGSEVRYILTINEANTYVLYRELNGVPVPPAGSRFSRLLTYWRLTQAHKIAYRVLKRANPDLMIGIAHQVSYDQPRDPKSRFDKIVAWGASYFWAYWFLNRIRRHLDFIGFNYYFTNYYDGAKQANPDKPKNDMGWYMAPGDISEVIMKLWIKYHKPIMITENGVPDEDDQYRQWWLKETMVAMIKAQQAGAKLIGYMHWSLLDNFEWAFGWWPKFGLVAVDRANGMKRTVRPSAIWWARQLQKLKNTD